MAISKGVLYLHGHPLAIVDLCPQNTLCRLACLKTRALPTQARPSGRQQGANGPARSHASRYPKQGIGGV